MWGTQPYTDENTARDNPVLAFLTYGEGYHNFHHIFQNDYRNGVKWYQWDSTKWILALLAALGAGRSVGLTPEADPVLAVCTHGRHDACCAERGRPLARALAAEPAGAPATRTAFPAASRSISASLSGRYSSPVSVDSAFFTSIAATMM